MKRRWTMVMAAILAILMVLPCFVLGGCAGKIEYTIEAGSKLPDPRDLIDAEGATYVAGFDETCVNRPGQYTIDLTDAAGKEYKLKLTVRDRTAPVVVSRHVYYAMGTTEPRAEDFILSIEEVDTYTAYFVENLPALDSLGDYEVVFRVEDASGNRSKDCRSLLTVIEDTEAPVFTSVPELSAYVGEAIAYRNGLVVTDNCGGEISVEVDASAVNAAVPGDYTVRYVATDACGNTASAETVIHIYEEQITEEQLYARIDAVIAEITTSDMNTEAKLRAAYDYVQAHITYVSDSDKSDWVRAAYDSLFVTGTGDCFNYFAAAKAFLIRFGLDYREIQRTPNVAEGTHFWLMVDINSATPGAEPRWYHYDCTRLQAAYNHSGCLLTDKQIHAYNKVRAGFYAYNSSNYPATDTYIITPTPELEDYY